MVKVRLKQQPFYEFKYQTLINVRDVNYGGHLSNDALVGLIHEARIFLINQLGFNELDLGDQKTGIIMTDLVVNYKKQGFLMDDITIYSHIDQIREIGFSLYHKVMREKDLLALVETNLIFYDYQSTAIGEIPEVFLKKVTDYKNAFLSG